MFCELNVCNITKSKPKKQLQLPLSPSTFYIEATRPFCADSFSREDDSKNAKREFLPPACLRFFAFENVSPLANGKVHDHYTAQTNVNSGLGLKENPDTDVTWVNQCLLT